MRAVVELAAFIELSSDDAVDPDAGVRSLESLASRLDELDPESKQRLARFCMEEAARVADPTYQRFLRKAPEALGFAAGA